MIFTLMAVIRFEPISIIITKIARNSFYFRQNEIPVLGGRIPAVSRPFRLTNIWTPAFAYVNTLNYIFGSLFSIKNAFHAFFYTSECANNFQLWTAAGQSVIYTIFPEWFMFMLFCLFVVVHFFHSSLYTGRWWCFRGRLQCKYHYSRRK